MCRWESQILGRDHFLSSEAPLIIGKTSCHWEYLLSSGVLPIIGKISRLPKYLLSSRVPLIIGKTSRLREYVAPLIVDSHFCQIGSALSTDTRYRLMPMRQKCVVEFLQQDSNNDLIFKINHFHTVIRLQRTINNLMKSILSKVK